MSGQGMVTSTSPESARHKRTFEKALGMYFMFPYSPVPLVCTYCTCFISFFLTPGTRLAQLHTPSTKELCHNHPAARTLLVKYLPQLPVEIVHRFHHAELPNIAISVRHPLFL